MLSALHCFRTLELPATVEKTGAKLFLQCPEFGGFTVVAASKYMTAVGGVLLF